MKTHWTIFVLASCFLGLVSGFAQQKFGTTNPSLGDIARQLKAQKSKDAKPAKVFTNDNLSAPADSGAAVVASGASKDALPKGTVTHDEVYYRAQLSRLQTQLQTHQRELDVLQQKLGLNAMQYYPDPNKTLLQEYSRSDINKKTDEIDAKKQQIADDEKAIEDLHDQLRREGGDPAWLR